MLKKLAMLPPVKQEPACQKTGRPNTSPMSSNQRVANGDSIVDYSYFMNNLPVKGLLCVGYGDLTEISSYFATSTTLSGFTQGSRAHDRCLSSTYHGAV